MRLDFGNWHGKREARVSFVPHLLTFLYLTYMDETLINPSVLWIYSRAHVLALAPRATVIRLNELGSPDDREQDSCHPFASVDCYPKHTAPA